jgi:ketosteroid isomerase-like protein
MGRSRYSVTGEIKDTAETFYRAITNRNLKALDALLVRAPYATVAGPSGAMHYGWEHVRLFWDTRFQQLGGDKVSVKLMNAVCHAVGDVGWLSGTERRTLALAGEPIVEDFRMTCVVERTSSGWQIASYHVSAGRDDQTQLAAAS